MFQFMNFFFFYLFVYRTPVQSCKKWLLTSSCLPVRLYMSVRPSAWNSLAPGGRIIFKLYIWWFLPKYVHEIMILGLIQSLTVISTRGISWGVEAAGAYGWQPCHFYVLSLNSGSLNCSPKGLSRSVQGLLLQRNRQTTLKINP